MNRRQWIIAGASIVGLLLFLYARSKAQSRVGAEAATEPSTQQPEGLDMDKRLQRGDRGPEVKRLQQLLMKEIYLTAGQDDGIFGPITETALLEARGVPATTLRAFIAGIKD